MAAFGKRELAENNGIGEPKPMSLVRKWHKRMIALLDAADQPIRGGRGAKRKSKLKRRN